MVDIDEVDSACLDPDQCLSRRRARNRYVIDAEHLGAAGRVNPYRFHPILFR